MPLIKYLIYTGHILLLFNTLCYAKALHKNKAFVVFLIFLIFSSITLSSMMFIAFYLHQNNLYMNTIFLIGQFILLSIFYHSLLKQRIIHYLGGITLCVLTYQYIRDPSLMMKYNPIGISITQILLISYAIVYFYKSLQLQRPTLIIVNVGIFLYLICSTLIFASGNLVFAIDIPFKLYDLLFKANAIMYIVFQILVSVEWKKNYYKKSRRLL